MIHTTDPHDHWFACVRCGIDQPKETRKKRAQPVQDAPRSKKAPKVDACAGADR